MLKGKNILITGSSSGIGAATYATGADFLFDGGYIIGK